MLGNSTRYHNGGGANILIVIWMNAPMLSHSIKLILLSYMKMYLMQKCDAKTKLTI
jgi:hypothetical protein